MLLQLTDLSPEPLYRQISRQLAERIRCGELPGGVFLDPVRKLARGQRVSPLTVERAYRELLDEGLIERQENKNYLVSARAKSRPSKIAAMEKNKHDPRPDQEQNRHIARIQAKLFPAAAWNNEYMTIAGSCKTCDIIGGDMYDYFPIDRHRLGVVIADACGHGVAAALFISQIQAIIKSEVKNGTSLKETMHFINTHIRTSFIKGTFITLFYGIIDSKAQTITYINAGHNFPFILRKIGDYEFLTNSSPALGLFDEPNFIHGQTDLMPGDRLVAYTDGITEAMNGNREEFGEERLLALVKTNRHREPAELVDFIQSSLDSQDWENNKDDRTLVILHVNEQTSQSQRSA